MINSVKIISCIYEEVKRIPVISSLIVSGVISANPIKPIEPSPGAFDSISYSDSLYNEHIDVMNYIDTFINSHPMLNSESASIELIKSSLKRARNISIINEKIREIIDKSILEIDREQTSKDKEKTTKRKQFEQIMNCIKSYSKAEFEFYEAIKEIENFKLKIDTKRIQSMGHILYIENDFNLNKTMFLQVVNSMLKTEHQIAKFEDILPESIFESKFSKKAPKVVDYENFEERIKDKFSEMNSKRYKIITEDGRDFNSLSAGWKTAIILDLILGWESDTATLIIDQPEDNLATTYINTGLISAIKKCKKNKQVILVSHNATIPMLGDAQNVILCKNNSGIITIRSDVLEGSIGGQRVVDHIAHITDGGKASIKKRVKKYNLKNYTEAKL